VYLDPGLLWSKYELIYLDPGLLRLKYELIYLDPRLLWLKYELIYLDPRPLRKSCRFSSTPSPARGRPLLPFIAPKFPHFFSTTITSIP